jgi:hypothetical protein
MISASGYSCFQAWEEGLGGRFKVLGWGRAGREIEWRRAWIIEADANVRSSIKRTYYHTSVRYEQELSNVALRREERREWEDTFAKTKTK